MQQTYFGHDCGNCAATGGPDHPLQRCARCKSIWYCNATCQQAHWKQHKASCTAYMKKLNAMSEENQKLNADLQAWVLKHDRALNFGANETLLPTRDYLQTEGHRLNTHYFHVTVEETRPGSGEFRLLSGRAAPIGDLKTMVDHAMPGGFASQTEKFLTSPTAAEAGKGKGLAGAMWLMVSCGKVATTIQFAIGLEVIEQRREQDGIPDWEEKLKEMTAPG
ncbi:hypothetical protein FRB94_005230 [Tulasnella sp. JGI-2019a]|nr:hypothetical protein FRB93_005915 [Tulasnella sp. JGI-2019a]KAG9000682.1 hypothetical protein FRB94_005230 [Tulasnella sp. JGI-2019a]